ncbi:MAG: Asp-tRNA(Asn)/Glu-tRNA(Gln) amidotransferase subunit GatC [Myxococcales bacterium]|nr:Asp-tRNA(Asn)/Glu-tRNA(Gln) amidotransferase subunit GatC [Myxococcales bacterium]
MPRITRAEVERVAVLARLSVSDEEADRLAVELDELLEYVETLRQVDTRDVEPTSHVIPLATPMREDRAVPGIDPELALANAPERQGTAFVVPKVIDGEDGG